MEMRSERGLFAVRLPADGGEARARLTGVHYRAAERRMAHKAAESDETAAIAEGRSPTYLVPDSIVGLAKNIARRCRSERDKGEAFSWAMAWGVELPESDLSERLEEAVGSTIGMTWADAPWNGEMSEDEVDETFDELGVSRAQLQKGKEDGTH